MADSWFDSWETRPLSNQSAYTVPSCRLVLADGREQVFSGGRILLGSSPDNDLVLAEDTVSRHHAEIRRLGSGYRIRDLESTNGVRVGGIRVVEAWLEPASRLRLGDAELVFAPGRCEVEVHAAGCDRLGGLVGASPAMRQLYGLIQAVAPTDVPVLLQGETGTGKELVARALHAESGRAARPFVVVDCGALPPQLLESELFGHEKGAFSGAIAGRKGLFEAARGGTVFLDEVAELPLDLQPRLLRVLERGEIRRVGANDSQRVDFRLVAASHRDLATAVRAGTFREDLFFRLNVVPVRIPALRERREDLPVLVAHFLVQAGAPAEALGPGWLAELAEHPFPGNVRELRNLVSRALALPPSLDFTGGSGASEKASSPVLPPFKVAKEEVVESFSRDYFSALYQATRGNLSQAARIAKLDRKHLRDLMRRFGFHE